MNTLRMDRLFSAILLVGVWALGARRAEAQVVIDPVAGYTNVGQFGVYGIGVGSYGGLGSPAVYGLGYGIENGQVGPGYRAANQFSRPPTLNTAPLTSTNYGAVSNAMSATPSWFASSASVRPRPHPKPTVPRDQLLSGDGKILWPSAAPDTPVRHAADDAVRTVVREAKDANNATIRHVIDARNKLTAYARASLPTVRAGNAADASGFERFIIELEKTLQTMALGY